MPTSLMKHTFKLALLFSVMLAGCTEMQVGAHLLKRADQDKCAANGAIKVGNPYLVDGIRYEPMKSSLGYSEKGIASWYGEDFHGKASANGECYNMYAFTAAHKTLPLPTIVRVTNLENNKSVVVKVNDRGPFVRGRIIDLSYAAAQSIDVVRYGTAPVQVEAIGGPHHLAGGYQGGGYKTADALIGRDQPAEFLASTAPVGGIKEESLAPLTPQPQPSAKELAKERRLVPPPAQNIPAPPEYEDRVFTNTKPLKKTLVYVQTGAYSSLDNAAAQKAKLMDIYETAAISKIDVDGKELLRVRAGPFRSVADADAALQKLVDAGFEGAQIKVED